MLENQDIQTELASFDYSATKQSNSVKKTAIAVAAAVTYGLVSTAYAEPLAVPPMTEIVTMITGMVAVVASVGMAVLSVYATAKVFKWVKTAF